jgi:hypothetical protein
MSRSFEAAASTIVDDFLARLPEPRPISTSVAEEDEMYRHALGSLRGSRDAAAILYFLKGRQVLEAVRAVARWRFGGLGRVSSFLDFASGWGRFTRFLTAELPRDRVTISEIAAEGLAFQQEEFGVRAVASSLEPRRFFAGGPYDLVLASSFFTHVPPSRFASWLDRLKSAVAPGGVLMFSTHGPGLAPPNTRVDDVAFQEESETARLQPSDYGTTWVTERYVFASLGGPCVVVPNGFCGEQDLYVVTFPTASQTDALDVPIVPRGDCDLFTLSPDGRAIAEGWVSDPAARITLFIGAREAGRRVQRGARWRFEFDWREIPGEEVLRVEAEAGAVPGILAMSPLAPHLPRTAIG